MFRCFECDGSASLHMLPREGRNDVQRFVENTACQHARGNGHGRVDWFELRILMPNRRYFSPFLALVLLLQHHGFNFNGSEAGLVVQGIKDLPAMIGTAPGRNKWPNQNLYAVAFGM